MRITSTKYALAGAALLVATTMSGCGSDSDSDSDASGGESSSASPSAAPDEEEGGESESDPAAPTGELKEFCEAYVSIGEDLSGLTGPAEEQATQAIAALKSWTQRMEDVGTPDEITDEAEEGFEVIVGAVGDLKEDANLEDLNNLEKGLAPDEVQASQAFSTWAAGECELAPAPAPEAPPAPEGPAPLEPSPAE